MVGIGQAPLGDVANHHDLTHVYGLALGPYETRQGIREAIKFGLVVEHRGQIAQMGVTES
jgi:hypothetical protein